jgi:hypothetical protein
MADVLTMTGAPLVTPHSLLEQLAERDDIVNVVVVVQLNNDMHESYWSCQQIKDLVHSAAVLQSIALDKAKQTLTEI